MTDEQSWTRFADLPRSRDLDDAEIGSRGESRASLAVSMWVFPRRKHGINATAMVRDAAHTYSPPAARRIAMNTRTKHQEHNHQHGFACGHVAIIHAGHTDYLYDGHLQYAHPDHVDEHVLEVSATNPERCTSS